jgi:Uma2 family endonuclease/antitoxin (DNA-binding transcriptional repressor) of toxin-antitoxin stability system
MGGAAMIVSSTEVQNNFGKYLMLAAKEDVIITRNGMVIAKLTAVEDDAAGEEKVSENLTKYGWYGGRKATYEEFLELTRHSEDRYEYIDGEIYYLASPKTVHQVVLTELLVIFHNWFQGKECRPLVAPYDITLRRHEKDINVVQPDLMVICDLEEKLDDGDYYRGVPTLVVEVLSEGTRSKDMVKKLDLYMSCGVTEYWIVNPFNEEVIVYLFQEKDIVNSATYRKPDCAESFHFKGLSVELARIFT